MRMKRRRDIHGKKKRRFPSKLLIGILLSFIIIGGSINITFADYDISSIISNWFNEKGSEAVEEVNNAMDKEREKQTKRLKEELQSEIESTEEALETFKKEEIEKRSEVLRSYANELIANFEADDSMNSKEKEKIIEKLDKTVEQAIKKMNNTTSKGPNKPKPHNETNDDDVSDEKIKTESEESERDEE